MTTSLARSDPRLRGKEICEIVPVALGGSPTDPRNKTALARGDHIEYVRYWNSMIRELRSQTSATDGDH